MGDEADYLIDCALNNGEDPFYGYDFDEVHMTKMRYIKILHEGDKATLYLFNGGKGWVPNSLHQKFGNNVLYIESWWLETKFKYLSSASEEFAEFVNRTE